MDESTWPNSLNAIVNQTRKEQNVDYQSNQKEDGEMEWAKQDVAKELININSIAKPTISVTQDQPRYYVDMLQFL